MTCTIKLKPSLQEFVRCAYLSGESRATAADTFGKLIKPWLSLPPRGYVPVASTSPDDFTFELPRYSDKNTAHNFYIYPQGQAYIATMLDSMFRTQLNLHLDSMLSKCPTLQIKDAIYDYCYAYGISFQSVTYEALKKSYYRYRKEKGDEKKVRSKKKASRFVPYVSPHSITGNANFF
jgi:hypothetical protein